MRSASCSRDQPRPSSTSKRSRSSSTPASAISSATSTLQDSASTWRKASGSSRDDPPERPAAGAAGQRRRPEGIPLGFQGSRTQHGGAPVRCFASEQRSPISGGALREGPLVQRPEPAHHRSGGMQRDPRSERHVAGQARQLVVATITDSRIAASSIEKYWPMHARGPAPNGK